MKTSRKIIAFLFASLISGCATDNQITDFNSLDGLWTCKAFWGDGRRPPKGMRTTGIAFQGSKMMYIGDWECPEDWQTFIIYSDRRPAEIRIQGMELCGVTNWVAGIVERRGETLKMAWSPASGAVQPRRFAPDKYVCYGIFTRQTSQSMPNKALVDTARKLAAPQR